MLRYGSGFAFIVLVGALLGNALSTLIPKIKTPMLIIGAGYMLFLAYKTFRSSGEIEEKEIKRGFFAGFALQFVNVKVLIYSIVSMEIYIIPYFNNRWLILCAFSLLIAAIGLSSIMCWGAFGSIFKKLFSKYARITNTVMALLLVWCAVSLFL